MIENVDLLEQYSTFCDNIKKYRKEKNLTQEELAELADLSISYVKQIESGKIFKNITLTTILKLSKALNTPLKILFSADKKV